MPIYEYECHECDNIEEFIARDLDQGNAIGYLQCTKCGGVCGRVMSAPDFRVTGFSSKNGYNLPKYEDVIK